MLTVTTVFDPETRALSYKEGSNRWAGTTEDNHSAQIVVEGIEALLDEYTAELVFGIPMYNNGVIYHPIGQIDAETQTYVLPNAILASARDGILPVELRLTKDSKVITSRNRLEISVVTAIDALRPFDGAYLPEIMGRSQEWAPDVQYAKGAIVIRDEVLYYSGRADNLGHDPKDGNISWWGEVSIVAIREYQTYIGDGVATQFTIAHHMLSPDLQFTVTHNGVDKTGDVTDMAMIDENNAVFTFSSPPQADTLLRINEAYRAINSPMWVWGMLESEEGMVAPEALFGVLEITDEKVTVRNGELGVNSSGRAYAGPEGLTKVLANEEDLEAHIIRTDNPHSVTKEQLGLQNVDPTSDLNKPISIATQTALNLKANSSDLTAHTGNTSNPHNVTKAQVGLSNVANVLQYSASNAPPYPVTSVAGKTGAVVLAEADIPALGAGKITSGTFADARIPALSISKITNLQTTLDGKVASNTAITAGTKTKITYDAKGLVTAGASLAESDIPSLSAGKITSGTFADARIPTSIERTSNKISSWQTTPDDTKYPTEKLVKGALDLKAVDSSVVHITGNESITGIKTFENKVNIGTSTTPREITLKGNLNIAGNIVQNGSAYETHAEQVYTAKDKIITREGAVSGLAAGETTGFTAKKYDGTNDGELALDNSGTIRVGDVGDTQPVLTRRESADLSSNGLLAWDSTGLRAITRTLLAGDIPSLAASKITSETFSDARIPTSIERTSNKISSWQTTPTDTAYPTEKLVKDSLDAKATASDLSSHESNLLNPHGVTKAQVGLSAVANELQYSASNPPPYPVTSVAGKTGAVVLAEADIPALSAGKITSGTFVDARIPDLDADKIVSGIFADARIPALEISKITGLQTALAGKQDTLTFDNTPISGSNNPVKSGGIHTVLTAHTNRTDNPHSVTKSQVNLGNVDNTSDINKPISTATQTALNAKQASITGGATTITSSNLTTSRALVSDGSGKVAVSAVTSTELGYLDGVTSAVQTQLNGKADAVGLNLHRINTTNPHSVTKKQVGLEFADNTADVDKPISTATQTALDGKVSKTGNETIDGVKTFSDSLTIEGESLTFSRPNGNFSMLTTYTLADDKVATQVMMSRSVDGNIATTAPFAFYAEGNDTWCGVTMRGTPGTNDVINKGYLDNRIATEEEAIGGSNNTALMTPLRVEQAFDEKFKVIDGVLNVLENGEWVQYEPK